LTFPNQFFKVFRNLTFNYYLFRALQNLTIFVTQEKRVDFSEVTGVRALSFRNLSVGEIPPEAGRKQNSPLDKLLKRLSPDP